MKRRKRDHVAETMYHLRQRLDLAWVPNLEDREAILEAKVETQKPKDGQPVAEEK